MSSGQGRRKVTIQQKRGTAAEWADANTILNFGEIGIEGTPTIGIDRMKSGDGVTAWLDLPYMAATDTGVNGITSPTLSSIVVTTESEFSVLAVKDPTTAYLVLPDP